MQRQQEKALLPLKEKQPLSTAPVPALIGEIRAMLSCLKDKQGELEAVQRKLAAESVVIDDTLKKGFKQILDEANISDCDPFIKLFWEEQKKALTRDPRGMWWHPMMIWFAIYLHYQSPRAYEALRNTGVLQLPNKATLRDYSNVLQPREGFQSQVLQEIGSAVEGLPENKHYAALMHDEMTIRGDLVYDHRGGELVGFVNPQAWTFHEEQLDLARERKNELKQQVTELEEQLDEMRKEHSTINNKWKAKSNVIGQLEEQVARMKELWENKEAKLTQERDKSLDAAGIAVNKIQALDDAFRRQLDAKEDSHQRAMEKLMLEKQEEIDEVNKQVIEVEEEMREILRESANAKRSMEEKFKKLSTAFADMQHDLL